MVCSHTNSHCSKSFVFHFSTEKGLGVILNFLYIVTYQKIFHTLLHAALEFSINLVLMYCRLRPWCFNITFCSTKWLPALQNNYTVWDETYHPMPVDDLMEIMPAISLGIFLLRMFEGSWEFISLWNSQNFNFAASGSRRSAGSGIYCCIDMSYIV